MSTIYGFAETLDQFLFSLIESVNLAEESKEYCQLSTKAENVIVELDESLENEKQKALLENLCDTFDSIEAVAINEFYRRGFSDAFKLLIAVLLGFNMGFPDGVGTNPQPVQECKKKKS